MSFDEDIWKEFCEKVNKKKNFPKRYSHFDLPFKVDNGLVKLKKMLLGKSKHTVAKHPFSPFVKIITKHPRYRYQESSQEYQLETKERPISFASHFDAFIFSYFDLVLKRNYQQYIRDKGFSECILAYRDDLNGYCNIQFAKEIFDWIEKNTKKGQAYSAIAFDISGYFDSIPHAELKRHWETVLGITMMDNDTFAVYKAITSYSYSVLATLKKHFNFSRVPKGKTLMDMMPSTISTSGKRYELFHYLRSSNLIAVNENKLELDKPDHPLGTGTIPVGIPQGSPISSTLSNVYLIEFDQHMFNVCNSMGCIYRRYCDDILIACKTGDLSYLKDRLKSQIELHGLTIQPRKTEIIHFKKYKKKLRGFDGSAKFKPGIFKNLQYLGFEFSGEKIYIRPGSLSRYFRKMKASIRNTLIKAYGKKSKSEKILIQSLLEKYSHLGDNNFIAYAKRAASPEYGTLPHTKPGMNSPSIRKQISNHFQILMTELEKENRQRYSKKRKEIAYRIKEGKPARAVVKRHL
ncbi:reverse transcriptase domain-containing protein [Mucilaginibacter sp. R-33]|uniref:reverse transcriptase domain-containing protein n=1 Tax=Mucilaginibacter sp. R-33 TaxID=3416711 RepID=UPI003CEA9270